MSELKAAIEEVERGYAEAWGKHDPKAMASCWTEDGDFMNPFGQLASGREAIEATFAQEQSTMMSQSTYAFQLNAAREVAPGVAVTDWTNTIHGMVAPDGTKLPPFEHQVSTVFVKEGDSWKKASARVYVFAPPPGPPPGE